MEANQTDNANPAEGVRVSDAVMLDPGLRIAPTWGCDSSTLYLGDALAALRELPDEFVDAVVTDPPYSSGGLMRADRVLKTSDKYVMSTSQADHPEFSGDSRDQRGFVLWCSLWQAECFRITKPGGVVMTFTDWRQLPSTTDAMQAGGWIWRGIMAWDKTEAVRPQRGWFRQQCEFIVTGSKGSLGREMERSVSKCQAGCFRYNVRNSEKRHQTGKPVELMQDLLSILPPNSLVIDPFAGSGTTMLAAKNLGHRSIGIEISREYCGRIIERLRQDVLPIRTEAVAETAPLPLSA